MNSNRMRPEAEPDRVRRRTAPDVNQRIDASVEKSIRYYAAQPREVISRRIHALEREWDIERVLQTNAASLGLLGLTLGIVKHRSWLGLPVAVLSFLLLHGVQGWCPPIPVLRRAGVRTREEIDREKFALKILRGDLDDLRPEPRNDRAGSVVEAVRR
jgi:hypothetical protein